MIGTLRCNIRIRVSNVHLPSRRHTARLYSSLSAHYIEYSRSVLQPAHVRRSSLFQNMISNIPESFENDPQWPIENTVVPVSKKVVTKLLQPSNHIGTRMLIKYLTYSKGKTINASFHLQQTTTQTNTEVS